MVSPIILDMDDRVLYAGSDTNFRTGEALHTSYRPNGPDSHYLTGRPCGAALLVRVAGVRKAGYLDDRFFLYHEETEWSLRFKQAGLAIAVLPTAIAHHDVRHGKAGGTITYHYYMTRNLLLLLRIANGRYPFLALLYSLYRSAVTVRSDLRISSEVGRSTARAMFKGYADFFMGRFGEQKVSFSLKPKAKGAPRV
jgi:GT2 family glycosyltransferase